VQNRTQQRIVNLDVSVVVDEIKLAKLVHEMTDAGSGGADHLRQCFLTNVRTDRLRAAFLPEIREQQPEFIVWQPCSYASPAPPRLRVHVGC
jgi:hypothetical protein